MAPRHASRGRALVTAIVSIGAAAAAYFWLQTFIPERVERVKADAYLLRGFRIEWKLAPHPLGFLEVNSHPATGAMGYAVRGGAEGVDRALGVIQVTGATGLRAVFGGYHPIEGGDRTISWDLLRFGLGSERLAVALTAFRADTAKAGGREGIEPQAIEARIAGVWREGTDLRCRVQASLQAGFRASDRRLPDALDFWPTVGLALVVLPAGAQVRADALDRTYDPEREGPGPALLAPLDVPVLAEAEAAQAGADVPLLTGFSWRVDGAGAGVPVREVSLDLEPVPGPGAGRRSVRVTERLSSEGAVGGPRTESPRVRSRVELQVVSGPGIATDTAIKSGRADAQE